MKYSYIFFDNPAITAAEFIEAIGGDANINSLDEEGILPIQAAISARNNLVAIGIINTEGFDVEAKNPSGFTALNSASQNSPDTYIMELLLAKGADVDTEDKWEGTPVFWAIQRHVWLFDLDLEDFRKLVSDKISLLLSYHSSVKKWHLETLQQQAYEHTEIEQWFEQKLELGGDLVQEVN